MWHAVSTVVRIGPALLQAQGHKRHTTLWHTFSVFFVFSECSVLFSCFWLSVPVQLIEAQVTYYVSSGTCTLTHNMIKTVRIKDFLLSYVQLS